MDYLNINLTPFFMGDYESKAPEVHRAGFYFSRNHLTDEGFAAVATAYLAHHDVLLTDYNLRGVAERKDNYYAHEGYVDPYEGVERAGGHRLYHIDHHYDAQGLAHQSATPLVQRWLANLHEHRAHVTLSRLPRAAYVANHCDQDILFSLYLARNPGDKDFVLYEAPILARAARVNDHVILDSDPKVTKLFFGGLHIEGLIKEECVHFHEAQSRYIPALLEWVFRGAEGGDALSVARGASEQEQIMTEGIDRIRLWDTQGRLRFKGRIAWLEAPERTENAYLKRYIQAEYPGRVDVQVLANPGHGGFTYKIRSHEDSLGLIPLFGRLNDALPRQASVVSGFHFGGRHSAGGSRPPIPPCTETVIGIVESFLREHKHLLTRG